MTIRRKLPALAAAALVLALTGCVRFQADLRLSPDDTVDGTLVVAVVVGDGTDARDQAQESADEIEEGLLGELRGAPGVTRTVYDQDGYLGSRFEFRDTPLEAFEGGSADQGSISIRREGDEFVFSGVLDFTPGDGDRVEEGDDTTNVTVAITFPGEVTEHDGELSGTTVRWSTTPEARIEMSARGSAIATTPPAWLWFVAGGSVLLVAAAAIYVVARSRRLARSSASISA